MNFPPRTPQTGSAVRAALLLATAVLLASILPGCGTPPVESPDRLQVTASFFPMYDFARKIAGDRADVTMMVPAGSEPHSWEPTAADIARMERADVFVYSGAGMEHWVDDVLGTLSNDTLTVVEASAGIALRESGDSHAEDKDTDGDHEAYDPHVWLSPPNAKVQMANIRDALIGADPEGTKTYNSNYEKWATEADRLDADFRAALAPYVGRRIVVAHEAFGYLCGAYGLVQIPVEGLTPDSEPDPARIAEVIRLVRENGIQVIFFEETASDKVAKTIAAETGARVGVLDPAAAVSADRIAAGEDWFSIQRDNLEAIAASFGDS
ncbi:MAG: zinc ABC transporter substrate-binding protein [Clostridia bacterium]|nr:zinc ABC transporter substrate-binding protein [Clostridia bacterium]